MGWMWLMFSHMEKKCWSHRGAFCTFCLIIQLLFNKTLYWLTRRHNVIVGMCRTQSCFYFIFLQRRRQTVQIIDRTMINAKYCSSPFSSSSVAAGILEGTLQRWLWVHFVGWLTFRLENSARRSYLNVLEDDTDTPPISRLCWPVADSDL